MLGHDIRFSDHHHRQFAANAIDNGYSFISSHGRPSSNHMIKPRAYPARITAAIGQRLHSAATFTQNKSANLIGKTNQQKSNAVFAANIRPVKSNQVEAQHTSASKGREPAYRQNLIDEGIQML